jgi:hypothetical protein
MFTRYEEMSMIKDEYSMSILRLCLYQCNKQMHLVLPCRNAADDTA